MGRFISPLTWPGGKSKQWRLIKEQLPKKKITIFFDIFLGGGSVLLNAIRDNLAFGYVGNDIDPYLINFWNYLNDQHSIDIPVPKTFEECKELYSKSNRQIKYFYDNNLNFSGLYNGTWTQKRFEQNFNQSKFDKLKECNKLLRKNNVEFLNRSFYDYNVIYKYDNLVGSLVFLDPPYFYNQKSKLYKYTDMDFEKLKNICDYISSVKGKFLLTIDNSPEVRELFKEYIIIEKEWKYTMSNTNKSNCKTGKELFIRNYKLEEEL